MPHKLTITGKGVTGIGYNVLLDDLPLHVTKLDLHMGVSDANILDISLIVDEIHNHVDVDVEEVKWQ